MGAANKNPAHSGDRGIDRLLARLEGVKSTGPGRWVALCSAHADRHPSLSIRETGDSTILVKCWAGCGAADVMAAIGLALKDLFAERPEHHRPPLRRGERWIPNDVWQCVEREAGVAAIAAADAAAGRPVSVEDAERVGLAADRLSDAVRALGVGR